MRILCYVLVKVVPKHHTKIIQNIPIDCIQTTSMFFERVLSLYRNITSYIYIEMPYIYKLKRKK